jgi:hypothetical protein
MCSDLDCALAEEGKRGILTAQYPPPVAKRPIALCRLYLTR